MNASSRPVADLLLHLCAAPEKELPESLIDHIRADDWDTIIHLSTDLRLVPLLMRAIEGAAWAETLPPHAIDQLTAIRRDFAFMALRQAKGIASLAGRLQNQGLAPIFLKGTGVAFGCYPSPNLRPLRDADILLSKEGALAAQDILLAQPAYGYLDKGHEGASRHHLRPLIDIETGLVIELHHRISSTDDWGGEDALVQLLAEKPQRLEILGQEIAVPCLSANALHLVAHAGRRACFDNGPLVLSDLHFLLRSGDVQMDEMLDRADDLGLTPSLAMIACLARSHGADWVAGPLEELADTATSFLPAAEQAMLVDRSMLQSKKHRDRMAEAERRDGLLAPLKKAFSPDPTAMALQVGLDPASMWRWLGYPVWLARRIAETIQARSAAGTRQERIANDELKRWMADG